MKLLVIVCLSLALLSGCASPTSLRCGVDGDSSFVELYNVKEAFSQNVRAYTFLCGFAYEGDQQKAELNIIDQTE